MGQATANVGYGSYSEEKAQIRHNALEASRQYIHKQLDTLLPGQYFFRVIPFPHHIQRENNQINAQKFTNYARKVAILTANIYGVDLDEEAVEIAQLNLLLKVLEQREKLPNLGHNIENGNSLISGEPKELEKYFGKGWKAKKPFNWEEKFSGVFKQGGFDVIIGNPPYIDSEEMVKNDKNFRIYCTEFYEGAKGNWDIFCIFVEKLKKRQDICRLYI